MIETVLGVAAPEVVPLLAETVLGETVSIDSCLTARSSGGSSSADIDTGRTHLAFLEPPNHPAPVQAEASQEYLATHKGIVFAEGRVYGAE